MDADDLQQKRLTVREYMNSLKQKVRQNKSKSRDLKRKASDIKKELANETAATLAQNTNQAIANRLINDLESRYERKQDEMQQQAQQLDEQAQQLADKIRRGDTIMSKIRRYEKRLRAAERRADYWSREADSYLNS